MTVYIIRFTHTPLHAALIAFLAAISVTVLGGVGTWCPLTPPKRWGSGAAPPQTPTPKCKVRENHVLAEELPYQGKTQQFWEHLMNIEALAIDKNNAEGY